MQKNILSFIALVLIASATFAEELKPFVLQSIVDDINVMERDVIVRHTVSLHGNSYQLIEMEDVSARKKMSQDEFAKIVASRLAVLSAANPVEFCAQFCQADSGEFGARITTIKSRLHCPVVNVCPTGMYKFGEDSIHNHVALGTYKQLKIDQELSAGLKLSGARVVKFTQRTDEFSDLDRQQQGYMLSMASYQLKYQDKRQGTTNSTDKLIATLEKP